MTTRIHTKVIMAIAAASMIAAAATPCASADPAKGTRIQIPPSLANFREPGSTGYVPQVTRVVIPSALSHSREPGSTGFVPQVGAEGFSLGVPLEYLNTGAPTHVTEGFSLGVPTEYLAQGSAPTHVSQGFNLGVPVQYLAQPTATVRGNGFDWWAAAIGAGAVFGLALASAGALMALRKRHTLAHV